MSTLSPQMAIVPSSPADAGTEVYATSAALGATTAITLQVTNQGRAKVALCRIKIKRVSGAAANFTPLIFSKSGVTTAGDITQEYAGAVTAVATLFDPAEPQSGPIPMVTDENGRLYLIIGPDAGANNVFQYMLRFYVYR
jgi:hypothetical protein